MFEIQDRGGTVIGPFNEVEAAMQAVRRLHIDAAILDFNLPDGNCMPVARYLRMRGVPFLVTTGSEELLKECPDNVVIKPYLEGELIKRLEEHLSRAAARHTEVRKSVNVVAAHAHRFNL